MGEHEWFKPPRWKFECCRLCGIIRRRDGKNKPCKGRIGVALRDIERDRDNLRSLVEYIAPSLPVLRAMLKVAVPRAAAKADEMIAEVESTMAALTQPKGDSNG